MPTVHIQRQHELSEDEVQQHLEGLARDLAERLQADYEWQGSRLEFRRSGAHGYVEQRPGEVEIWIKLGLLLAPLKPKAESVITSYLDRVLA